MSRRTFLLRSAEVGLGLAAVGLGATAIRRDDDRPRVRRGAFAEPGNPRVAVLPASSYDVDLRTVVREGLTEVGAALEGRTVVLKPNLVEYDAGTVIDTDPRLIHAAALAVRDLGATSVTVGEGPGHRRDTEYILRASGLAAALRDAEVPFTDLNTAEIVHHQLDSFYTPLGELWLPKAIVDADVVISMPKLKTHHWAGATISMKNCFGCIPGRVYGWPKNVLHWAGLEQSILDVAAAVHPDYQIVDGIVAMEGDGPIRGTPLDIGAVIIGTDMVATDATAARLLGFDPERIRYLAEAGRFLGQVHLEEIRQVGEDPDRLAQDAQVLPTFEHMKVGASSRPSDAEDAPA